MSHWDNGYNYNQYQDGSWRNNQNISQHNNQSNNQYVSFNEFLSQVQSSGVAGNSGSNVNNQFHNATANQYAYPNINLEGHNLHQIDSYNSGSSLSNIPSSVDSYQVNTQGQYNTPASESHLNTSEMVLKSNLMPTAMEFIPKRPFVASSASEHISASNLASNETSSGNWREEPYDSNQQVYISHQKEMKPDKDQSINEHPQKSGKEIDNNSAEQKHNSINHEYVNKKYSAHNGTGGPSDKYGSSYEQYQNKNELSKPGISKSYENESHNRQSNSHNQDNNSESSSRNKDINNYKHNSKNKNADSPRTYYNSSGSKGNSDRRGRGDNAGRTKVWAGSQRLGAVDRNSTEDEQYASNYLQYKDERQNHNNKSDRQKERYSKDDKTERSHKDDRQYKENRPERYRVDQSDRQNNRQYRDDRSDKQYRENRSDRQFKEDRSEVQYREEKPDQSYRDNRSERQYREDRSDRQYRDERAHRSYREDRSERQYREDRSDRQYRDERTHRSYRDDQSDRQYQEDRSDKKEKPDQSYRDNRSERQYREDRSDRQYRDERTHRSYRDDQSDRQYQEDKYKERSERQYKGERLAKGLKGDLSQKTLDQSSPKSKNTKNLSAIQGNSDLTQRDRLGEQLDTGTLECLVCCERVRQIDQVWSCSNCYHVLHLRCIRKWAISSLVEGKWRCPACQNTTTDIPTEYRCMCGAMRNPEYHRGSSAAHTCGGTCRRPRNCPHPCTLLCHPGPCPPCQATVNKQCGCGAETRSVLCSNKMPQVCGRVCNRTLECGKHQCQKNCHEGPCDSCKETVTQVCFCPAAKERTVECTSENNSSPLWSCGAECGRVLSCGAHVCRRNCHPPPCDTCQLLPEIVTTCPCGKMRLDKQARKSCTDVIPVCGNICAKPLMCGPDGDNHFCKVDCHQGPCPVCDDSTLLQCRCGHSSREVPCADLPTMRDNVFCQKKCNKKLSCGRHRCRTVCCGAQSHRCAVVCGRALSCQLHRCEEFCHTGHCAPCPRVSFEELSCECGAEVVFPPVRCGTRPPVCKRPCVRVRQCLHPPHHSCHQGDCPPCVVLTTKTCHGGHEERKTIPCSQEEFSCGLPCGKPLPCGKHTCIKTCHKGPCDSGKCTQPCAMARPSCGHPCAAPCHSATDGVCPSAAPCKRLVTAVCPCGRRQAQRTCAENAKDYNKIQAALAATKMQEGSSVDIAEMRPGNMLKTLECDDECRVEQRTRQMALALQIRNPDISSKLAPRYSDHIRGIAVKDPGFAQQVHDKLTELVQLAKKSKQRTRSHSFPSMNYQKRQFIHELCEHFGCESVAYDAEPNRNVVATADKERSWLPAMSIIEVLAREAGKRRVPGPILRAANNNAGGVTTSVSSASSASRPTGWATLTSTNAWAARSQAKSAPPQDKKEDKPEDKTDYFDNTPENWTQRDSD